MYAIICEQASRNVDFFVTIVMSSIWKSEMGELTMTYPQTVHNAVIQCRMLYCDTSLSDFQRENLGSGIEIRIFFISLKSVSQRIKFLL